MQRGASGRRLLAVFESGQFTSATGPDSGGQGSGSQQISREQGSPEQGSQELSLPEQGSERPSWLRRWVVNPTVTVFTAINVHVVQPGVALAGLLVRLFYRYVLCPIGWSLRWIWRRVIGPVLELLSLIADLFSFVFHVVLLPFRLIGRLLDW
ncbi:hypothetical protein [Kineosporia babensis]|uniref:Uncharacterized protein n=1 Tax=Kineosporia babensis TaxID=499548 RepID=A0A9X1NGZ0_9ACTN|nr:hypothetical protein [Kineosporia babensis]MCD5313709.1 hypothetical protein [Kineosporia babensis]